MEEEKVTPPPINAPTPPKPQPVIIRKSSNAPLVGAIVFLALVIGAAAIFLGTQKKATTITSDNLPVTPTTTTPEPTSSPDPTITQVQLNTYTSTKVKDLAFNTYSISYPEEWIQKEDKTDITHTLTLTKGGNEIKIYQAPMGGSQCIFEGAMPDGPATDYRKSKFVEIKSGNITLRKILPDAKPGKIISTFCSNSEASKASFGVPTIYGAITFTQDTPDSATLSEMDTIIKSLK